MVIWKLTSGFEAFATGRVQPAAEAASLAQLNTSAWLTLPPKHGTYPPGPLQAPAVERRYIDAGDAVVLADSTGGTGAKKRDATAINTAMPTSAITAKLLETW